MAIVLRTAAHADIPMLEELIARSARGLSGADYRGSQIEGALRGAFGVDTQLLNDQTYFVAEEDGLPAGCGGWSFRATLFGSDARPGATPRRSILALKRQKFAPSSSIPPRRGAASAPCCSIGASARRVHADFRGLSSWRPCPASGSTPPAVTSGRRRCAMTSAAARASSSCR